MNLIKDNIEKKDDAINVGQIKANLLRIRAQYLESAKKYRLLADEYEIKADRYDKAICLIEDNMDNMIIYMESDFDLNNIKDLDDKSPINGTSINHVKRRKIKWRKEAVVIIKENKKLMLNGEILEAILPFDLEEKDKKRYTILLSGALNKLSNPPINKLKTYNKNGIKGYYYGLPEWFNEYNEPKEEYRP